MIEQISYDNTLSEDQTQSRQTLQATLLSIVYSSNTSSYLVGRFEIEGELFPIIATGEMFNPSIGDSYLLHGDWIQHPKYGRQYKWVSYEIAYPSTRDGIERYLSSGLIKGIGKATARKIVIKYGLQAIDIMNSDIDRLTEIEGIGRKKLEAIKESWEKQRGVQNVMMYLKSHDIGTGYAVRIFQVYGNDAIRRINQNPYCLIDDVEGIGFVLADRIARRLGFDSNDLRRLIAGICYVMKEAARSTGHTFLPFDECVHAAGKILEADEDSILSALNKAIHEQLLLLIDQHIYIPELYYAEISVANSLKLLLAQSVDRIEHCVIDELLRDIEKNSKIEFVPIQVEAIHKAVSGPVTILTGGPGTGKTTTVAGILAIANFLSLSVALCAPTGRAAKRLTEITGRDAKTIHRILEFDPRSGIFQKCEDYPLDANLIVVDEVSMVDIILMAHLLQAIPKNARLVLVGDADQLPSVGPGNVLRDMISSGQIETIILHFIFRQNESSTIISNSHRVREGFMPVFGNETFFMEHDHPETIARMIQDVVVNRIPRELHYDPLREIQVLSPMHKSVTGVTNLNHLLQKELNGTAPIIYHKGDRLLRLGDKVMQTRNNYEKEVFNGDIGFIHTLEDEEGQVIVQFDERFVPYSFEELDDLTLAYAITIHKSQGSEYEVVVLPVTLHHRIMLQRNLIYTAMTRAKNLIVFIGQKGALGYAVRNEKMSLRYSSLRDFLIQILR